MWGHFDKIANTVWRFRSWKESGDFRRQVKGAWRADHCLTRPSSNQSKGGTGAEILRVFVYKQISSIKISSKPQVQEDILRAIKAKSTGRIPSLAFRSLGDKRKKV